MCTSLPRVYALPHGTALPYAQYAGENPHAILPCKIALLLNTRPFCRRTELQMFDRTTRQGLPYATVFDGRECVTTLPAPITTLSPIVTPGRMMAPPPIHTWRPMTPGAVRV